MNFIKKLRSIIISAGLLLLPFLHVFAQDKLDKKITVSIHQKTLTQALVEIGRKGGFHFSYNTKIITGDSVVSVRAEDKPVRQILEKLLGGGYEYEESGNYIIILQKAVAVTAPVKIYTVSGYVKDEDSHQKISNVSIYESEQLVTVLTDTNGFFRLRLRDNKYAHATLVISKQLYRDTLLFVQPGVDQQLNVTISHEKVAELQPFVVTNRVEKTWLGKLFLSSKEVVQSLNIIDFFANKPYQFSLTPGLGTHGRMGAQVVNKLSVNVIGGYTAGINGVELAGIFNIDKKEVKYVQAAGIFNVVGGDVIGVQLAGIHNQVLDSVVGVQAGGISNMAMGNFVGVQLGGIVNIVEKNMMGVQAAGIYNMEMDSMQGVQLSGLFNHVQKNMRGVQAAGIMNNVPARTDGLQVAGLANSSKKEMRGMQISTIVNYTKRLKGLQIGLINIADTSSGWQIGVINIVIHGMHRFSLSANEMLPLNLAYKSGSNKMYSIVQVGFSPEQHAKAYGFGYGIGYGVNFSPNFSLATELIQQNVYVGRWKHLPQVYRLQTLAQLKLGKNISLFAGPAISLYDPAYFQPSEGYKTILPGAGYQTFAVGNCRAWVGWTAGINFF